ncbi:MAG: hypothetical protein CFE34_00160 [Rhodobacteraceae bacterium PARR1]|nr:MAG: hypothetical protein CFE34_00160 [Rhodobacteraceae bacterium PARR1]
MDTAFFIASKVIWAALRPDSLLMLVLAASWLVWRKWPKLARNLLGVTLLAMATIAAWPVQSLLFTPLEDRFPQPAIPDQVAGIIILGGAELADLTAARDQVQLNAGAERMTAAMTLALRHPTAKVIFTGGSGNLRGGAAGAEVAKRLFAELGLPPDRLVLESASRNTAENATMTLALVQPQPGGNWLLVTSAYHMPRAVAAFCAAGWTGLIPYPVDYRSPGDRAGWRFSENAEALATALREWIGLAAYRLTGRATDPSPACLSPE